MFKHWAFSAHFSAILWSTLLAGEIHWQKWTTTKHRRNASKSRFAYHLSIIGSNVIVINILNSCSLKEWTMCRACRPPSFYLMKPIFRARSTLLSFWIFSRIFLVIHLLPRFRTSRLLLISNSIFIDLINKL